ncbi:GNAT family N-acetyltransferase [Acidaminobacter sp. JC074]|uniref:GNAT family N-acetyltransferase n=1 Tax=Acidaminobacter sp. JC074 TaxID=2530199 RepID=UPI001F0EBFDA|nr:GNAT family N-acetyltransferase [Acidaminobacter sp. JC074]MCH4886226.1 GNAT family N-acetyltransferase [Acidaminobacter sp. JC074]
MNIQIEKMKNSDFVNAKDQLDFYDADVELTSALEKKSHDLYKIVNGDDLLGLIQIEQGKHAYLYVYIDPKYRNKGLGQRALEIGEDMIDKDQAELILTMYKLDTDISKAFAIKNAYLRKFSSTYMTYNGDKFECGDLPVRQYKDDDYESAHELYARAFHEMRLSTGDFPDSIIEKPSTQMKEHWHKTSKDRLVYTKSKEIVAYAHLEGKELSSVSVKTSHHNQGIGSGFIKYICNQILDEHDCVDLFCVVGNKARHLYDKLGFKVVYTAEFATKKV